MKRFYGGISLLVIFLLLTAGSWYIDDRTNHIAANEEIMISWFIYTTSTVLNLYYSYYNALLVGRGLVKENNQLIIITRSTYLVLAALGLIAGYGLIAVATANFLSIIINWWRFIFSTETVSAKSSGIPKQQKKNYYLFYG